MYLTELTFHLHHFIPLGLIHYNLRITSSSLLPDLIRLINSFANTANELFHIIRNLKLPLTELALHLSKKSKIKKERLTLNLTFLGSHH